MIGKKLLKKIKVAHAIWRDNWQYSGSYTREGAIKKARIPLFFDMLYSELTTGSDPHNYYMFYFENLSQQERRKWITNHVNAHTAARHSGKEIWNLFEDKAKFNARFKDYVKRRWLDTRTSSSEQITEFIKSLGRVIVKPLNMSAGEGIFLLHADDIDKTKQLFSNIREGHHCLLEEVKENVAHLPQYHPCGDLSQQQRRTAFPMYCIANGKYRQLYRQFHRWRCYELHRHEDRTALHSRH